MCKEKAQEFRCSSSNGSNNQITKILNIGSYMVLMSFADPIWQFMADFVSQQTFRSLPWASLNEENAKDLDCVFSFFLKKMKFVNFLLVII